MTTSDATANLHVSRSGGTMLLRLDRPEKLNAITPDMARGLRAAADAINADPGVRCAVFTGTGERAFSAGSDIGLLDTYATPWEFRNRAEYNDILRSIRVPVIAAVNGLALGGGLELALACDIILAVPKALFGAPEIRLGWVGGGGVTAGLVAAIGARNAAYMLMTGEPISAEQAQRWGLVTEVVETERLLERAHEIARGIGENAPLAVEIAKINIAAALNMPFEQAIDYERDLQTISFATADAAEGRTAFKEKRLPRFVRR